MPRAKILRCCGECQHFKMLPDAQIIGDCRRYPPVVTGYHGITWDKSVGSDKGIAVDASTFGFPQVESQQVCGEFRRKP